MKAATYAYRGTNHPGDLHEFLDQAIPEQTETKRILARSKLIPPNTLDLPEWEPVRRWSTLQGKNGRKTAVLATMKIEDGWLDLDIRDEEDEFSGNEIPPEILGRLDQN